MKRRFGQNLSSLKMKLDIYTTTNDVEFASRIANDLAAINIFIYINGLPYQKVKYGYYGFGERVVIIILPGEITAEMDISYESNKTNYVHVIPITKEKIVNFTIPDEFHSVQIASLYDYNFGLSQIKKVINRWIRDLEQRVKTPISEEINYRSNGDRYLPWCFAFSLILGGIFCFGGAGGSLLNLNNVDASSVDPIQFLFKLALLFIIGFIVIPLAVMGTFLAVRKIVQDQRIRKAMAYIDANLPKQYHL